MSSRVYILLDVVENEVDRVARALKNKSGCKDSGCGGGFAECSRGNTSA